MNSLPTISIVIPTFNREEVLIDTIEDLLNLKHKAHEIIVVDQTVKHGAHVDESLSEMHNVQKIRWIKLSKPSITNAMNIGALKSTGDVVLFLDDDIQTRSELVLEHAKRYQLGDINSVAGQVIQSWEAELKAEDGSYLDGNREDPDAFMFNSAISKEVRRFIGCNVSFVRADLLKVGGFDTNFSKVAYRYEAESAERFVNSGRTMVFEPAASLRHLQEKSGGTRSFGDHKKTIKPSHSVGRYYYFLVVKNQHKRWLRFFSSPFSSCVTRFHLKNPWYIPVTLIAEFSGMFWAIFLVLKGQKLLDPLTTATDDL